MRVDMYRTQDSGNNPATNPAAWVVRLPDGSFLNTAGSVTQGLQEAINWAVSNGYGLKVHGGGIAAKNGQDVSIINCNVGIVVPPLQGAKIEIHATINFGASGPVAFRLNSMMSSYFGLFGQIVCAPGWGVGFQVKPTLELPQDPEGPVVTSSELRVASVVMTGGGVCVDFDASQGGISSNLITLIEPNAGGTGVRVKAGNLTAFDHNTINIRDCHGQSCGINAGCGPEFAHNIFCNVWNAQIDPVGGSVGAEIWGRRDDWVLSVTNLEGQPVNGITLNATAERNRIHFLRNDANNKVNNATPYPNAISGI